MHVFSCVGRQRTVDGKLMRSYRADLGLRFIAHLLNSWISAAAQHLDEVETMASRIQKGDEPSNKKLLGFCVQGAAAEC